MGLWLPGLKEHNAFRPGVFYRTNPVSFTIRSRPIKKRGCVPIYGPADVNAPTFGSGSRICVTVEPRPNSPRGGGLGLLDYPQVAPAPHRESPFIDAPAQRPGHGCERGTEQASRRRHPRRSHLVQRCIGAGRPHITGGGYGGQDPFRVGWVAVEDEDAPQAIRAGLWMMGYTGDPSSRVIPRARSVRNHRAGPHGPSPARLLLLAFTILSCVPRELSG
jgi:hypothetical protein